MNRLARLAFVALPLMAGCGNPAPPVDLKQPAATSQEAKQDAQSQRFQDAQSQRFADLLAEGKKAVEERRYEDAIARYEEAIRVQDDSPTRELLARAKVTRDSARLLPFDQTMQKGRDAAEAKNHTAAAAAFREASRLFPENETATTSLQSAEFHDYFYKGRVAFKDQRYAQAIAALAEATKRRPDDPEAANLLKDARAQRRAQALEQGKAAMEAKQYSQAVALFTEVNTLSSDAAAMTLLKEANFQMRLERGRKGLDSKQFTTAIPDLEEVTRLKPEFAEGRTLLQQARDGKKAQDMEDYKRAIAAGDAAMQRKDYSGAVDSYREAQNKQPGDLTASSKLSEAQAAKTKQDSYKRHMDLAKSYMNSKNYASAESEYRSASLDASGDSAAQIGLRDAQNGKMKKAAYDRNMSQGKAHLAGKNYAAAESSFRAALSEMPGDSAAQSGLRDAQNDKTKKAAYDRNMSQGKAHLAGRNYAAAESSFRSALSEMPGDSAASSSLREAQSMLQKSLQPKLKGK